MAEKTTRLKKMVETRRQRREKRRSMDFMPTALEALESPPAPLYRAIINIILLFISIAIAWAIFSHMDIVVSGTGVVIPKGKVKVIQPLEPGIVTAIHVRDGQRVSEGELLISMDDSESLADIASFTKELETSDLTILRLEAELTGEPSHFIAPPNADVNIVALQRRLLGESMATQEERLVALNREIQRTDVECTLLNGNISRLAESLPLSQQLFKKKKTLAEKKLISEAELLQAEIEINNVRHDLSTARERLHEAEARLERARDEIRLAEAEYSRDLLSQLTEAKNRKSQLEHQLEKAQNRKNHRELRSPTEGIVQQLAVNTVGGVVTSAQPLLVIVPTGAGVEIEAKILNKDIGFIKEQLPVSVKVSAYPYTRYGDLDGTIEWVAKDAVVDEQLGPIYPIKVKINSLKLPNLVNGRQGILSPGMTVTTDVKVGQRRVIEYFLGPVMRYKDESLREI
ncbi:HlyD family type I secretion periplasmic adaptor subunit [Desulforhopalus singaporensis]|uniref:Hemolysin D n=1 Tax=Desulforhopalus singaporensis TaxID=91360 RepID=A0A1H0RZG7_9BACT|nr:HlyD family type I secretion periplasmic adaptor subunit [Desulforhopalus singaporensis]SDP34719.1 hemolysin D [Desulforhopalus singaporensis]